ncbi:hypothetical protein IKO70_01890 [bacterium]|nr:hypothetical protein [bacterium]
MQTFFKWFLAVLLVFLVFSCSSSHSSNDSDILPDADADTQDFESQDDDADTQEAEIVDDSDEKPDQDNDSDTEKSDSDECQPPLSEAPFPYYDANGKITFCRPGCDTPTEKDPQCVRNLWNEQNEKLCHEYPEYACCRMPCVMESLKPMTKEKVDEMYTTNIAMHKCDLKISPWSWGYDASHGVVKAWNMNEGKVGFYMYPAEISYEKWSVGDKYVTYDIATQKYSLVIPGRGQEQAYYKGKRLALISDKRSYDLNNENIFLAYISDDGKVEIVYDKKVKSISYEPALNEKWAFVNLVDSESKRMLYAKIGEWKWTSLGNGVANHTSLADNYLGIYDDDKNGYICDLSKNPKSFSDCMKINRENEKVSIIRFNQDTPQEFVFNLNGVGITKAKIKDEKIVDYQTIISDFTSETADNAYTLSPYQFRGNLLLYVEITYKDGSGSGGRLCYYRLDKNKKYCMKKMEKDESYSDGTTKFPYGFSEFEGAWLLYQKLNSTPFILRDMDCYCKEEGVCPFEE